MAVLTAKRAEDKAKLKEMEKFKVQYQQMSEYKDQWSSKQVRYHGYHGYHTIVTILVHSTVVTMVTMCTVTMLLSW